MPPPPQMAEPARLEVTREAGALRAVHRVPSSPGQAIVLLLWLAFWAVGWRMVAGELLRGRQPAGALAFLAVWLTIWTLAGLLVLWSAAAAIAGREEIAIDARTLGLRRSVLGIGRTRRYDLSEIEELAPLPGAGARGAIGFRHRGKGVRFGAGLGPHDAERIIAELRGRMPARAKSGF